MIYILILASTSLAITLPAYDALVADLTNPDNRKRAYSLIYMGHNLGFAIAPIVGGLLYKKYLSFVFICDALSTIISVILISVYIKDYYRNNKKSKDFFSKNEKSSEEALIKILFKRRILLYFAIVLFCYNFAYSQWGFAMPLQLVEIFNEKGSSYYGFLAGFNGLLILVSTPFITRYTQQIKSISVIAIGGILYAVAFSILAYTNLLVVFFLSVSIMTIGEVMISVNASTFVANNTPATHRGRVNAVIPMIYGAGFTLGPLAMGGILRRYELKQAWLFVSSIVLFAGVVMFIMGKITRKKFANLV
jgi:MFS family permease